MIPSNRAEFKEKILRELGKPVVAVNMADSQVEDCIDDALQYWGLYHAYAQERTFYKIQLSQADIDSKSVTLPDNILGVVRVLNPMGLGGTVSNTTGDNLFSFQYQFTATSIWDLVNFGNISGYFIANQYLSEVERLLGQVPVVRYSRYTNKLELDFRTTAYEAGAFLVAEVYAILNPEVYNRVWSDRDLLRLAVAYAKKVWGRNLKKYQGFQLPGGMQINGDAIYQEGVEEAQEMEARIIRMQPPISFIVA